MATSSYEHGLRKGVWTLELVYQYGFSSAAECLAHQERLYQSEMAGLSQLTDRQFAARHAEYMEGLITAMRQSLRQLM